MTGEAIASQENQQDKKRCRCGGAVVTLLNWPFTSWPFIGPLLAPYQLTSRRFFCVLGTVDASHLHVIIKVRACKKCLRICGINIDISASGISESEALATYRTPVKYSGLIFCDFISSLLKGDIKNSLPGVVTKADF